MDVVEGSSHLLCGEPQQVCGADSAAEQSRAQVGVLGILQVEDQLPELALVPSAACARQRLSAPVPPGPEESQALLELIVTQLKKADIEVMNLD